MAAEILIDGSNVLFWRGQQAQADLPDLVVRALVARRFAPVIHFDHSIRLHMEQGALDALAQMARVVIAPRGTPADPALLTACQQGRIQIVSCDRFQAWRGQYPGLCRTWLVTGRIEKGGHVGFSKTLRPAPL